MIAYLSELRIRLSQLSILLRRRIHVDVIHISPQLNAISSSYDGRRCGQRPEESIGLDVEQKQYIVMK